MKGRALALVVGLMASFASIALDASRQQETGAAAAKAPAAPGASQMGREQARGLLDRYCVSCHSERLKQGSLVLESADLTRVGHEGEKWEKVVRKLEGRLMPPAGRPRPDEATYKSFIGYLSGELV